MNAALMIDRGIWFAAAAGILGVACELISLVIPFYYVHLAAGLCFAAGLVAGLVYAVCKRADMKQAARRLDSFGLKERMITAYEQIDNESELARMQRQDALLCYNEARGRIQISLLPDRRHVLALVLSAALVVGMGFIPSAVRDQARVAHQVQKQAKDEKDQLKELVDALEAVDPESLTEEQKDRLKELAEAMKLSQEELAKANSWESLVSAMEKLNYKYEQAGQSLEKLASQLENPEAAGVAGAEALAKAAAGQSGQQSASGQAANGSSGQSGDGDSGDGDGSGDGEGNGNGNGNGSGEGNGNGNGNRNGNGNGNGNGAGSGSGRGTGSSDAAHDYVSIPNDIGDDSSLTGDKNGDQDSDYYRQQNGLAWTGDHVDYSSVIGEYTDSAYEGIANGKYPSGMENVIRDYFETLNQ